MAEEALLRGAWNGGALMVGWTDVAILWTLKIFKEPLAYRYNCMRPTSVLGLHILKEGRIIVLRREGRGSLYIRIPRCQDAQTLIFKTCIRLNHELFTTGSLRGASRLAAW